MRVKQRRRPRGSALAGPLAHPGVRGRPLHAEKRAQAARLDRIPAAGRLRAGLQKRRNLEGEHREARHQAVGKGDPAGLDRVGNAVEAFAHRPEHAGHREMPAEGVSGHSAARSLPVLPQDSISGPKSLRKKFVAIPQPTDNERKENLPGIAGDVFLLIASRSTSGKSRFGHSFLTTVSHLEAAISKGAVTLICIPVSISPVRGMLLAVEVAFPEQRIANFPAARTNRVSAQV